MKSFLAALPLFSLLLPSAFGAYTFSIAGGAPPGTWEVQDALTNTVTITFDVSEASGTGNGVDDFHVDTFECGSDQAHYTVSTGLGLNVQDDANDLTIVFTNDQHITLTTYCIQVHLKVDGATNPVATRQFTYAVSAPDSGTNPSVTWTSTDLSGLDTNAMGAAAATGISGAVNPGLTASSTSIGTAVNYGDVFTIEVTALSGFDTQITGVVSDCGATTLSANTGRVSFPALASVGVTLPITCFTDAAVASVLLTVTVDWWVNLAAVRRLRGLQADEELPEEGSFDYSFEVAIEPLGDGSSATVTKFYYCASAAGASVAAALLL